MLVAAISRAANHVLATAGWAREKLAPHAGKAARFEMSAIRFTLQVTDDSLLAPAQHATEPSVVIRFQPGAVLRTLGDRRQAWRNAEVEGDAEFASAISQVAANLEWDVEEDLSRLVGDIVAHRLALAGRTAAAWPRQAAQSLAANASEYLTEEARLLVTPLQAAEFVREVDELRDAVERLEKRIDHLSRVR
jgi:ubiquinone biosynthesis accessory factor UbiJ